MATKTGTLSAAADVVTLGGFSQPSVDNEVQFVASGTYGTAVLALELKTAGGSWVGIDSVNQQSSARTSGGSVAPADNGSASWLARCNSFIDARVRCVSIVSGSVSVEINSGRFESIPSIVVAPVVSVGPTYADSVAVTLGTGSDITIAWDGTDLDVLQATPNSSIKWGISGAGIDQVWYGDTAAADMTWDQSADSLIFGDNAKVVLGTGSDITFCWDGTDLDVTQATANSSIKWGVSGAGIDHVFYGDTAGRNMTWDQSADSLLFGDNAKVVFGDGSDMVIAWNATSLAVTQAAANSAILLGVSGAGIDLQLYGDTAGSDLLWDQSADALLFADNAKLAIGTGADIVFAWDATRLNVTQATVNSEIRWGIDGAGIDQMWYGDTASAYMQWDQSADKLILGGVAKIQLQTIAAATGTAIPVTHSGSFPVTQNGAETNTLADPTFIGQQIDIFVDTDTSGARVITAASRINQAANTIITLTEVGDYIRLVAITIAGALKWQVVSNDGAVLS